MTAKWPFLITEALVVGVLGLGTVTLPAPRPANEFTDAFLVMDFDTVQPAGFGQKEALEARWEELAGDYYARSYGLTEEAIIDGDLVARHVPTPDGPNGSTVQGIRLGEDDKRFPGRELWLRYTFELAEWPYQRMANGKLWGIAGGENFPSAGSDRPVEEQWRGFSARQLFRGSDGVMWLKTYWYDYLPDRPTRGGRQEFVMESPGSDKRYEVPPGTEVTLVQRVVLNSDADTKDGIGQLWVEDADELEVPLRFTKDDLRWYGPKSYDWRDDEDIFGIYFSHFFGGNHETAPPFTAYAEFDDIVIGPTAQSVGYTLSEDENLEVITEDTVGRYLLVAATVAVVTGAVLTAIWRWLDWRQRE